MDDVRGDFPHIICTMDDVRGDKHSFHKQFILSQIVNNALIYLKNNNSFYSDTEFNAQWETISEGQSKELWSATTNNSENSANDSQEETIVDSEDEIDNDNPPEVVEYLQ